MEIPYNICFITRKSAKGLEVLMLFRKKNPNKSKWNGIGGKIEAEETIDESMIREIKEETGLKVKNLEVRGMVTWNREGVMYVYRAEYNEGEPIDCEEGTLEWKPYSWVMGSKEVVSNIKWYLEDVLFGSHMYEFACTYVGDQLTDVKKRHLSMLPDNHSRQPDFIGF